MPARKPAKALRKRPARDVAAGLKAEKAMQLRRLGLSYQQIAVQCEYNSRQAAFNAVQRELDRALQEPAEALRKMELERLDDLWRAMAPKAYKGDTWSVDRCLAIMERRARFLGLDAPANVKLSGGLEHSLVPQGQARAFAQEMLDAVRHLPAAREALSLRLLASGE